MGFQPMPHFQVLCQFPMWRLSSTHRQAGYRWPTQSHRHLTKFPLPWRCHHPPSCPRTRLPIFAPNNATCSRRWKEYVPTRPAPTGGASAAQTRSSWCAAVPPSEVDTDKGRMIGTPARPTTQCSDLTGGVLNRQRPCRGLWISWSA